jgi:hydroxyacylglutathione hydrolase
LGREVQIHRIVVGLLETNCYILAGPDNREAVVVDPGGGAGLVLHRLQQLRLNPKLILSTHAHFDHVLAVDELRSATGAEFLIHHEDLPILESMRERARAFMGIEVPPPPKADRFIKEGDEISVGGVTWKVMHTPGHSPGSICLHAPGILLSGDTIFSGSIGRTDTPGGDYGRILESIGTKIMVLPDDTVIYPGHGPSTTVGRERKANPFVQEALKRGGRI